MRILTRKDGALKSCSDEIDEIEGGIDNSALIRAAIHNHDVAANQGNVTGQLHLEHIFWFCKTFKKVTKSSGFEITLILSNLQETPLNNITWHFS